MVIHLDIFSQPTRGQIVQNALQLHRRFAGFDELIHFGQRKTERGELLFAFFGRCAFQFVNNLKELVFVFMLAVLAGKKLVPGISAAQADDKILPGQTKRAQRIYEQGN